MRYEIYQIKDPKNCDYMFAWKYDAAKERGFDFNDYEKVYEGEIEDDLEMYVLEKLFTIFNVKRPQDFKGHSLSVSDIIKLDDKYYYVEDFGFRVIDVDK